VNGLRAAIALGAILVRSASAAAQSKTQAAREAAETGRRAYNLNHWDEAIAAFEKAYQLSGDPALLFNLAQAHRQALHGNEAVHFYKTYLREQPDGPNREVAEKQLNELQAQNWHDPFDTPDRAGAPRAPIAPAPVTPAPVTPARGPTAPVAPPPAAATSSITVIAPATDAPVVVSPPAPALPASRTPLPRWLPLSGAIASVALMSAAILYGVSASNRYDWLASSCGQTAAGCTASDIDDVRARDRIATVLWIATGVVATGTGVAAVVNARAAGVSALWRF
jgi:tetratricopeptide (TPR) repeat protein